MGMKVKLPSLLKPRDWPSCKQNPKTLSFRDNALVTNDHSRIFKTLNSVYFDPSQCQSSALETPESWFSQNTSATASCPSSSDSEDDLAAGGPDDDPVEAVIRGARSENSRLFFDPGETSSIVLEKKIPDHYVVGGQPPAAAAGAEEEDDEKEEQRGRGGLDEDDVVDDEGNTTTDSPFKESVVMAMESEDPYMDFRRSMEEMVETHGMMKDWGCLEELLGWYLRVNGKKNHGYIVGAFVDLLVGLCSNSSINPNYNPDQDFVYRTSSSSSINGGSSAPVRGDDLLLLSSSANNDNQYHKNKSTTSFSSAASSFCSSSSSCGGNSDD